VYSTAVYYDEIKDYKRLYYRPIRWYKIQWYFLSDPNIFWFQHFGYYSWLTSCFKTRNKAEPPKQHILLSLFNSFHTGVSQ